MAASGSVQRKAPPALKPGKGGTHGTIRVARPILAPTPPRPVAVVEEALAPGLPCSGRCGHCNHHPCRLHGGV